MLEPTYIPFQHILDLLLPIKGVSISSGPGYTVNFTGSDP